MSSRLRTLGIAVVVAIALLAAARQITPSHGYSSHPVYRAQVDAFLSGRLALSRSPDGLQHDLAWTPSGTQQVWGLGVPLWQTPFEVVGRITGLTPFPDRVPMIAFLALGFFMLLRAFPGWRGIGALLVTGLLPAITAMVRSRMQPYEDAALYAYIAEMILLAGTVIFVRAPTRGRYLWLLAAAGLVGLIRPTSWFYGLAAAIVATVAWWRAGGRRSIAVGAALFLLGGAALYETNALRFGRGTEFGHRLNIASLPGNLVATRFSYPFERVGIVEASEELLGSLFDRPERQSKRGFYQQNLHAGQSETARWREYYFTTFSWPYVPLLAAGMVLAVLGFRRRDGTTMALVAFAALGSAPLWWFYLHSPSVSSRYQLDLAPAFAVLLVIGWRELAARVDLRVATTIVAALWALAVVTSTVHRPRKAYSDPVDRDDATEAYDVSRPLEWTHALPDAYDADDPLVATWVGTTWKLERCVDAWGELIGCAAPEQPGDVHYRGELDDKHWLVWRSEVGDNVDLPDELVLSQELLYLNGFDWRVDGDQAIPVACHFYVEDPRFLEVETYGGDPNKIRARIGDVALQPVAFASTRRGIRVHFEATEPLPAGLQVAFIAFGEDTTIDRDRSAYKLRSVRWR